MYCGRCVDNDHQKTEIEGLIEDLELSKTLLQLALSVYHDKKQSAQLVQFHADMTSVAVQASRFSQQISDPQTPSYPSSTVVTRPENFEQSGVLQDSSSPAFARHQSVPRCNSSPNRRLIKRKPGKQVLHMRVWWSLFSSKVWDFAVSNACSGWDIHIRVYNEVPHSSKIFYLCQRGDIEGIRRLVMSGAASLQDQAGSTTLLKVSSQLLSIM